MNADAWRELVKTETDRIEWKQSTQDREGICQAVCALANDLGATGDHGYVVVGINKHGDMTGIDTRKRTLDEAQQQVSGQMRDITLQPTPSTAIFAVETSPGTHVLVIEVAPYHVPPIVTFNGVAWVRVGTTTRRATSADQSRLRERRPELNQPFDLRPVKEASLDDLDLKTLQQTFEAAKIDDPAPDSFPQFETWLAQRELGRKRDGRFVPNATAVLLFGKSPQSFLPGAYVDLVRYSGTDVAGDILFRQFVTGVLPDQLDALWRLFRGAVLSVPIEKQGIREGFSGEYPVEALEELVRNLIQHRAYDITHAPARIEWFDDRIEFVNPGGPFGQASEGEFGTHSDYRNPTITRFLSELGYVQKLGRGIRRVRIALERYGCPPLASETDGYTRVVVRRRPS
jgi:ATP-dependent DNA helicase RecG